MRFWRRHRTPEPSPEVSEGLWRARRLLADAERRDCAAEEVARRLEETKSRNHFAEAIRDALRGNRTA